MWPLEGSLRGYTKGTTLLTPSRHLLSASQGQGQEGEFCINSTLPLWKPRDRAQPLSRLQTPLKHTIPPSSNKPTGERCQAACAGLWHAAPSSTRQLRGHGLHAGLRDVALAAQDHTACKWQSQDQNPDLLHPLPDGHWSSWTPCLPPEQQEVGEGGAASGDGVCWGQVDTCAGWSDVKGF